MTDMTEMTRRQIIEQGNEMVNRRLDTIVRQLHDLDEERARLIIHLRDGGASLREIAEHAGMTHVGVKKLIARHSVAEVTAR